MKKTISILLLILMVSALFACASGERKADTSGTFKAEAEMEAQATAASSTPVPTPEPTPEPTPAPTATPSPLPTVRTSGTAKGSVAEKFSEGLAWFKDAAGNYGFIDTTGQVVIPAQYRFACLFCNGLAVASYSDRGAVHDVLIDKNGQIVFRNMDSGSVYVDYKDIFDRDVFPAVEIYRATVKNNKYQSIDHEGFNYLVADGKLLTKDKFYYVGGFMDGIAKVGIGKKPNKTMVLTNGANMDPPYMKFVTFSGNQSSDTATAFYHIRRDGSRVEKNNYDNAGDFSEGLAAVAKYDVKGVLKWGYVDTEGKVVIPLAWDTASRFKDGIAIVSRDGLYGAIDTAGELVIPLSFERLYMFSEDLAIVHKDGKQGYIDRTGNMVIPAQWDSAGSFTDGRAIVGKKNGDDWDCTVIDATGVPVLDKTYPGITRLGTHFSFSETKGGPWGLMTADGEIVFGPTWDGITLLGDESMLLKVKQGDRFGLIDWNGVVVREPEFDSIGLASDGVSIVKKEGFWFILDPVTGGIIF